MVLSRSKARAPSRERSLNALSPSRAFAAPVDLVLPIQANRAAETRRDRSSSTSKRTAQSACGPRGSAPVRHGGTGTGRPRLVASICRRWPRKQNQFSRLCASTGFAREHARFSASCMCWRSRSDTPSKGLGIDSAMSSQSRSSIGNRRPRPELHRRRKPRRAGRRPRALDGPATAAVRLKLVHHRNQPA